MFPDAGFGSLSLSPLGVFSSTSGKTAERMVVGPTAPHGMEGCAALLDKRRASGAATFLSDRDRAGPGSEQSSSCSRERESKVGAESREEFLGRRRGRGRQAGGGHLGREGASLVVVRLTAGCSRRRVHQQLPHHLRAGQQAVSGLYNNDKRNDNS